MRGRGTRGEPTGCSAAVIRASRVLERRTPGWFGVPSAGCSPPLASSSGSRCAVTHSSKERSAAEVTRRIDGGLIDGVPTDRLAADGSGRVTSPAPGRPGCPTADSPAADLSGSAVSSVPGRTNRGVSVLFRRWAVPMAVRRSSGVRSPDSGATPAEGAAPRSVTGCTSGCVSVRLCWRGVSMGVRGSSRDRSPDHGSSATASCPDVLPFGTPPTSSARLRTAERDGRRLPSDRRAFTSTRCAAVRTVWTANAGSAWRGVGRCTSPRVGRAVPPDSGVSIPLRAVVFGDGVVVNEESLGSPRVGEPPSWAGDLSGSMPRRAKVRCSATRSRGKPSAGAVVGEAEVAGAERERWASAAMARGAVAEERPEAGRAAATEGFPSVTSGTIRRAIPPGAVIAPASVVPPRRRAIGTPRRAAGAGPIWRRSTVRASWSTRSFPVVNGVAAAPVFSSGHGQ